HLRDGGRIWDVCRHLLQLVEGVPGARGWRRNLGINAQKANADLNVMENAARQLEEAGL
ncbi:MAG TPA: tRNA dihydrouridine(20/20a) synthase DusA, partial [Prochlorococcaceae cyanobacterium Fu_MAG_50]|nr:tRNA dihydrouridine(20/20a) synthase DusA [Prochlorococcaceae cyanobacterium Fu_MAG_50]